MLFSGWVQGIQCDTLENTVLIVGGSGKLLWFCWALEARLDQCSWILYSVYSENLVRRVLCPVSFDKGVQNQIKQVSLLQNFQQSLRCQCTCEWPVITTAVCLWHRLPSHLFLYLSSSQCQRHHSVVPFPLLLGHVLHLLFLHSPSIYRRD